MPRYVNRDQRGEMTVLGIRLAFVQLCCLTVRVLDVQNQKARECDQLTSKPVSIFLGDSQSQSQQQRQYRYS